MEAKLKLKEKLNAVEINSIPDIIKTHVRFFKKGVTDSLDFVFVLLVLYNSPSIRKNTIKTLLLNGLIFLGSMIFFEYFIVPINLRILNIFLKEETRFKINLNAVYIFNFIYYIFWILPIFFLSLILNSIWYNTIARDTYAVINSQKLELVKKKMKTVDNSEDFDTSIDNMNIEHFQNRFLKQQKNKNKSNDDISFSYKNLLKNMAEEIYRLLVVLNFLVYSSLLNVFFRPLGFINFCWLTSYYSFEYNWISKGWSIEKRIRYLEENWSYFLGFGFPCTVATFFLSTFVSQGLFSLLFPAFIIISHNSHPEPNFKSVETTNDKAESKSRGFNELNNIKFLNSTLEVLFLRKFPIFFISNDFVDLVIYSIIRKDLVYADKRSRRCIDNFKSAFKELSFSNPFCLLSWCNTSDSNSQQGGDNF
ncbi:Etoposide induced 2.4 mRNA [Lobulomyces angularis]|nr:Etoposide induced 2.4 mRNA [Lobulomyces angularis]